MMTPAFGEFTVSPILEHRGLFMKPLDLYPEPTAEVIAALRDRLQSMVFVAATLRDNDAAIDVPDMPMTAGFAAADAIGLPNF